MPQKPTISTTPKVEFNQQSAEIAFFQFISANMDEKEFCDRTIAFFESNFPPMKVSICLQPLPNQAPQGLDSDCTRNPLFETLGIPAEKLQATTVFSTPQSSVGESDPTGSSPINRYRLPLSAVNQLLGVITFDLPEGQLLTEPMRSEFNKIGILLAQKLLQIQLNSQLQTITLRHENEMRHISQNLHDTLGQSIGFIRLKLEQIRHDFPGRRNPEISQELDRVQAVTEEAYLQMRELLAELHPNSAIDLTTALSTQSSIHAQRAGFDFVMNTSGQPFPLSPLVKRQVLYIFREALNNIERHAHASQVELCIQWENSTCKLSLVDNGIGFNPKAQPQPDHYGLIIMQERAQDISAELNLDSTPGKGTVVSLVIPVAIVS